MSWIRQTKKAVAAFIGQSLTWAGVVVASDSQPVTVEEWLALAGIVGTTLVVYFLTNESAPDA